MPRRQYPAAVPAAGGLTMSDGYGLNPSTSHLITAAENNFTVELWVKPTSTHGIDGESTSGFGGTQGQKFVIDPYWGGATASTAGMGISVGTNGVSVYEHADGYMPALLVWQGTVSGWTHIAVVYQNRIPRLYINGVLVKTGLQSPKAHVHPGNLVASGLYGTMTGEVDEVRIWKTIRTAAQIQATMNREVTAPQPDLEAYWPIGDNGTTTLTDVSGNGHDVVLPNTYTTGNYTSTGSPIAVKDGYRYGFNGKENDKDITEGGQDYGMRIYDSRLGRWMSVDPLQSKTPHESPYIYCGDNPLVYVDPDGRKKTVTTVLIFQKSDGSYIKVVDTKIVSKELKMKRHMLADDAITREDREIFKGQSAGYDWFDINEVHTIVIKNRKLMSATSTTNQGDFRTNTDVSWQWYANLKIGDLIEDGGIVFYSADGGGEETRTAEFPDGQMEDVGLLLAAIDMSKSAGEATSLIKEVQDLVNSKKLSDKIKNFRDVIEHISSILELLPDLKKEDPTKANDNSTTVPPKITPPIPGTPKTYNKIKFVRTNHAGSDSPGYQDVADPEKPDTQWVNIYIDTTKKKGK